MARLHDDWCLLFYPFGVVIWQDVSNMSCKDGMSPLCVANVRKKLQLPKLLIPFTQAIKQRTIPLRYWRVNRESAYVVVGDLVFITLPTSNVEGQPIYTAARMTYTPNGTSAGDIMTHKKFFLSGNGLKESVMSFLRIKQSLDLANKSYDYTNIYVTNVKAKDAEAAAAIYDAIANAIETINVSFIFKTAK